MITKQTSTKKLTLIMIHLQHQLSLQHPKQKHRFPAIHGQVAHKTFWNWKKDIFDVGLLVHYYNYIENNIRQGDNSDTQQKKHPLFENIFFRKIKSNNLFERGFEMEDDFLFFLML